MVSTAELEVDNVALCCNDRLRVKFLRRASWEWVRQELCLCNEETYEASLAVLAGTDQDGDIGGRYEGGSESCNDGDGGRGSGELHGAERLLT